MELMENAHVHFAKSPLRYVVCQVRYPILPRYSEGGFVSSFIGALQSEYPGATREQQVGLEITAAGVKTNMPEFLWRLASRDGLWAVVFGESSVSLEARNYSTVDEFANRMNRVLLALQENLGVSELTRLGLRYVNEIRYPNANTLDDWRKLLYTEFLGFAALGVIDGRVKHMLQEAQFERDDGTFMVRHGLLTGAVIAPLPGETPPVGPFYLIDLDYFNSDQARLDVDAIMKYIRDYNDVMSRFFRSTLTEKLYEYLEPHDDSH